MLRPPPRPGRLNRCKSQVKAAGLSGPGKVRVNKAGCLDRCAGGPVAVVYPEAVWYTYVDASDIDEIVESHLKNGVTLPRDMEVGQAKNVRSVEHNDPVELVCGAGHSAN